MQKKYDPMYDNSIGPELAGANEKDAALTKYKFEAVFFLVLGVVVALQVATQFFASEMGYSPLLGKPLFSSFYPFYEIFLWQPFSANYPNEYGKSLSLGMSVFMIFLVIVMILKFKMGNRLKENKYLHGSARWANRNDIERMGLLPHIPTKKEIRQARKQHKDPFKNVKQEGVFVGAWQDRKTGKIMYLRHNGPEHVLCVAPTRSGKGVGLVNPTLLTWREAAFVMDLKGELWALTSGWRKKYAKNRCIRFEPAEPRVCIDKEKDLYNVARWNPLDEIRSEGSTEYYYDYQEKKIKERICSGVQEIADVQNIATLIVDPDGKGLEDHWAKTAFALLVGAIIHLKHNCPDRCNLHTLDLMLAGQVDTAAIRQKRKNAAYDDDFDFSEQEEKNEDSGGIKNLWADMKLGLDCDGKEYAAREAVITAGADMFDRPDEEAGSVLSTAKSFLSLYRDPIVSKNTEVSDFRIKQLMNMDDPVSLYVVTQPNDKSRLKPLVRLMVNLVVRLLADKMEFEGGRSVKGYAHRILLMLDEFPSLGKLDIMQESLAFVAGYGIKAYLIVQDMSQLYTLYGKDESISSNCHVSNFYAPLRTDTAEIMSKKCGTTTITHESISLSGEGFKTNRSRSMQETQRPLLTVDECMQLPSPKKDSNGNIVESGKMLVFVAGFPPIYGVQPLYFQDPVLLERAKVHAPKASDVILKDGKAVEIEIMSESQSSETSGSSESENKEDTKEKNSEANSKEKTEKPDKEKKTKKKIIIKEK